jgi:Cys-rich protein (TIGR01571 family)
MYFWVGVVLWSALLYSNSLVAGLVSPILTLLGAVYRHKLRVHFGFPTSGTTMCQDFVAWCCCMPCAIAQEARHVDRMVTPTMID